MTDTTRKINSTEIGFKNDLSKLIYILKRNCYPFQIIEKAIKNYYRTNNKELKRV